MPTLYDNFERVRQYIDQHQGGGGDMSAYVTKDELSAQSYLTAVPAEYVTGDELDQVLVAYITDAELSACGYVSGAEISQMGYLTSIPSTYASYNGVYSYLSNLGINNGGSQGWSYIEAPELHDAELNGEILINGISTDELPTYAAISNMGYMTQADSYAYLSIENLRTNNNRPVQLRAVGLQFISSNYTIAPREISYEYINTSSYNNAWVGNTTLKNYVNGRLAEIEASYVTSTTLENAGYISAVSEGNFDSVVNLEGASKIAAEDGLTIDTGWDFIYLNNQTFANDTLLSSNIIPQVTNTYTLGDSSHIYSNTYSRGVYLGTGVRMFSEGSASSNDMAISLGGVSYFYLNNNRFAPNGATNNEKLDLGTADRKWNHIYGKSVNVDTTYTSNLYAENVSYTSGKSSIKLNDRNVDIWANNKKMVNVSDYNGVVPTQTNVNLGGSSNKWAATYTANLYTDTAYLQDTSYTKSIVPTETNAYTLGDSTYLYAAAYTSKAYTQSVNINHTSRNGWIISSEGSGNELQLKPYNAQRTINVIDYYGNKMLRMYANNASTNYSYSYCVTYFDKPVYFNDTTNLIWTGTSAEYAALDNYTSYQIYMIKEA